MTDRCGKDLSQVEAVRSAVAALLLAGLVAGCVQLPEAQLPDEEGLTVIALDQQWNGYQRELFYHQTQGSVLLPYEWLMALEQPEIKFFGDVGMFMDPDYIARFGFLPGRPVPASAVDGSGYRSPTADCTPSDDPESPDYNCGLPVGFSRAIVPMIGGVFEEDVVGLTCAACHTGELHFGDVAIRIDGATNLMDPTNFQSALGGAMLLTQQLPFRFNRFADRVVGEDASDEVRDELRAKVDAFMAEGSAEQLAAMRKRLYADYPGGFGRTDALARITNMVFGTEMNNDDNLSVGDAPVKFPAIWDAPYFDWAQYNGSIEQSMTRNIGEALGVRAKVDYLAGGPSWAGEGTYRIETTTHIPGLFAIETLLRGAGDDYFNGLSSPVWPEEHLGQINWSQARQGASLYDQHCAYCHLPPIADLVEPDPQRPGFLRPVEPDGSRPVRGAGGGTWISNNDPDMLGDLVPGPYAQEEWFLRLQYVNLGTIRTDPGEAANFARNIIDTRQILLPWVPRFTTHPDGSVTPTEQFPQRIIPAGVGLQMVTIAIVNDYYDRVDAQLGGSGGEAAFAASLPWNLLQDNAAGGPPPPGGERVPADGIIVDGRINRDLWNGYRPPGAIVDTAYRPRPLNGIWASPPYLHNGSVPNIYELLSPHEERSRAFWTGSRQYDPRNVGYRTERLRGAFWYDTRATGNSNDGHRFEAGTPGDGTIGPELSDAERLAIVEFLKTLCPAGRRTDYQAETLCASIRTGGSGQ